jgi:hypothetical protein
MAKGTRERYGELLTILGRAAGLSGLALSTLASGPCGPCTVYDDCATIKELLDARADGIASASSVTGSAGRAAELAANVAMANTWDGTSCPTPEQYGAIVQLKFTDRYSDGTLKASDVSVAGKCCYHFSGNDCSRGGRPFLVQGEPRVPTLEGEGAAQAAWLRDAQVEYASVAAFARLSLQLMALGAPTELVHGAQRASLDELRHAEFFFCLASREAGRELRAGQLDVSGALDDWSLAGLIESNLLEGCIGETQAAEALRQRAAVITDVELSTSLQAIADDETRHAELAFRILAWCRDTAPDLTRSVLARVLEAEHPTRTADAMWQQVLAPLLGALTV